MITDGWQFLGENTNYIAEIYLFAPGKQKQNIVFLAKAAIWDLCEETERERELELELELSIFQSLQGHPAQGRDS